MDRSKSSKINVISGFGFVIFIHIISCSLGLKCPNIIPAECKCLEQNEFFNISCSSHDEIISMKRELTTKSQSITFQSSNLFNEKMYKFFEHLEHNSPNSDVPTKVHIDSCPVSILSLIINFDLIEKTCMRITSMLDGSKHIGSG